MNDLREILDLSDLELHALTLPVGTADQRRQMFVCYLSLREKIGNDFLPHVNSAIPFLNDHTRAHLRRVLKHLEGLLQLNFPEGATVDVSRGREITWVDTLILLNALVWHDLGNIYGREGHARRVHDCFEVISGTLYEPHLAQWIKRVAEAHSGVDAIQRVLPQTYAVTHWRGTEIHPRFLAAALRLADELDEDNERAKPPEWRQHDLIPPESQRFWFFNSANGSIRVVAQPGEHSHELNVQIRSQILVKDFDEEFQVGGGRTIRALAEYFRRVWKLDMERRYCNQFLREGYYHPGVAGIDVQVTTDHSEDASADVVSFRLTDSQDLELVAKTLVSSKISPYIREALEFHD